MKLRSKALGGVFGTVLVIVLLVYGWSSYRMGRTYDVALDTVVVPTDSAALEWGAHLALTRGCEHCHGASLGGNSFIDAMPVARLWASNLTSGEGGVAFRYEEQDWVRSIRNGINPEGKALKFMPSNEFWHFSDRDVGALVAHIMQLDPVNNRGFANAVGPLGRILFLAGQFPLLPAESIDQGAPRPPAVPEGETAAYGRSLTDIGCVGCHGPEFSGGPIPGVGPDWPEAANITLHTETGIGAWSEEDFFIALREGRRPDGTTLRPEFMPWPAMGQMTDTELRAIWLYLRTIPGKESGGR